MYTQQCRIAKLYPPSQDIITAVKYWIDVTGDAVCTSIASAFYICQQMIFKSHLGRVYPLDVIEELGPHKTTGAVGLL